MQHAPKILSFTAETVLQKRFLQSLGFTGKKFESPNKNQLI